MSKNNSFYEYRHINQFYDNIEDLMYNVNMKKFNTSDPEIDEITKIQEVILNYIKDKKRKIYGGYALNILLKEKKAQEEIYQEYEIPDIDIYTPEPMNDLITLCNLLHENNFKYVRGREALHKETYAIYVNNKQYCNLTYVPKNIYNKIPFKIINELYITHPYFLMIDYLRVLTDPIVSYWRLQDKKTFERLYYLNKYYSLPFSDKNINIGTNDTSENVLKSILNFTSNNSNIAHIGFFAFNFYLNNSFILDKKIERIQPINIPYYEIVSTNYKDNVLKLKSLLEEENITDNITIEEYYPFFQYIGYSTKIFYNNQLVCIIYDNNNRCMQFKKHKVNKDEYLIGSYNYCLLNYLTTQMKYKVENNEEMKNKYYILISQFIEFKKNYFKTTKKTIFDKSPFEDFTLEFIGTTLPPEKERQMIGESRKKKNKPFLFTYEPSSKPKDKQDDVDDKVEDKKEMVKYIFSNTSGNKITNIKKSKIFSKNENDLDNLDIIEEENVEEELIL